MFKTAQPARGRLEAWLRYTEKFRFPPRRKTCGMPLRDVGAAHKRLFPGVLTDAYIEEGGAARIVTFGKGAVVRELLVDIDDTERRFAYAVVDGPLNLLHHNASMQVFDDGDGGTRFVWITDVLPDEAAPRVRELVEQGSRVVKQTLEG